MTRNGWFAAVLGLSLAGAANAQQRDTGKQGRTEDHPDTDTQALSRQSENNMQAQGIQLSALDENQIKAVQTTLREAGYYQGTIDGIAGGATKQALSRLYSDQAQLALRGQILPLGAASLGLEQSEIEGVRGEDSADEAQPSRPSEQQRPQRPDQQRQLDQPRQPSGQ